MKQEDFIKRCSELLYKLCDTVERLNSLNFYDINISSEYFFIPLLDELFGWNLTNANALQKNTAIIDLVDNEKRIAVQVTSDSSPQKIHSTLSEFRIKETYKKYDRLVFVVIIKSKNYRADFEKDTQGFFSFSKEKDIFTIGSLINEIKKQPIDKLNYICNYLEFQIDTALDAEHIWSSKEAFEYISCSTNNILKENYFEIDDEQFVEKFTDILDKKDVIHVFALSCEEGLYCILNLLNKIKTDTPVYIIRDKSSWEKAKSILANCIVIPDFFSNEIPAIGGNKTIYISNSDYYLSERLPLPRRTRSFLSHKLRDNGYEDSHRLIEKTHGMFYYIKRELFVGEIAAPDWAKDNNKAVVVAALVGKWMECDGDKSVIEKLYGASYDEFMAYLQKYIGDEHAYIVKRFRNVPHATYELADALLAWQSHKKVLEPFLEAFFETAIDVISDFESLKVDTVDSRVLFSTENASKYSFTIKEGMIRSLVFLALYDDQQIKVDNYIKSICSKVENWKNISEHIDLLCEASPEAVISKLELGLQNDTGLMVLFELEQPNLFFGTPHYIRILWAIEKLIVCNKYAIPAVQLLLKLSERIEKCSAGNNPRDIVSRAFSTWFNGSSLTIENKIDLAKNATEKYYFFWNILFGLIYQTHSLWYSDARFQYRECEPLQHYSRTEIKILTEKYTGILLDNIDNDVDRVVKMISILPECNEKTYDKFAEQFHNLVTNLNDVDKEKVKTTLRETIFSQRYYNSDNLKKDRLDNLEDLFHSINFTDLTYDFLYLSMTQIPILKPTVRSGDSCSYKEFQNATEVVLLSEFQRFKSLSISIKKFLSLIDCSVYNLLGSRIAKYYSCGLFDEHVFSEIYEGSNSKGVAVDYVLECCKNDNDLIYHVLEFLRNNNYDNELYVSILSTAQINEKTISIINNLSDQLADQYWKRSRFLLANPTNELIEYMIHNYSKYYNWSNLFCLIAENLSKFNLEELISILSSSVSQMIKNNHRVSSIEPYWIEKIIIEIHNRVDMDYVYYNEIAPLEITLFFLIGRDCMKCTRHLLKTDANYFADLIKLIYKNDDGKSYAKIDSDKFVNLYKLYSEITFCPGEINGDIDDDILQTWIKTFEKRLTEQNQHRMFTHCLGMLFANSPAGDDGNLPHESIRKVIEELGDDGLLNSFAIAILNKRGVYYVTNGKDEHDLAVNYRKIAESLQILYPKTAKIYDILSDDYMLQSKHDRQMAEDGLF